MPRRKWKAYLNTSMYLLSFYKLFLWKYECKLYFFDKCRLFTFLCNQLFVYFDQFLISLIKSSFKKITHKHFPFRALKKDLLSHLHKRDNQYLLQFSFWPKVTPREKSHIYELRSYYLKPGTMVEWGNYWARAIRMRDYANQEAFVGMFSQVGELYQVNHIWCYDSLSDRWGIFKKCICIFFCLS